MGVAPSLIAMMIRKSHSSPIPEYYIDTVTPDTVDEADLISTDFELTFDPMFDTPGTISGVEAYDEADPDTLYAVSFVRASPMSVIVTFVPMFVAGAFTMRFRVSQVGAAPVDSPAISVYEPLTLWGFGLTTGDTISPLLTLSEYNADVLVNTTSEDLP